MTKLATAPVGTAVTFTAKAGVPLNNVVVATFTEVDPANVSANFVASINWGDTTPPTAGTITLLGTGSYEITGSHTYAASGNYPVDVTLTDQNTSGTTTVGGTTINVTSNGPVLSTPNPIVSTVNVAPVLLPNSVFDLTGVALKGVAQDVETTQDVATFMSKDTAAVPTDFTATINWGDGTATTAGIITEDASNTFHVSGTHIYTKAGSFTPSVTIKDLNGALYQTGFFDQTNLVSSVFGNAVQQDPNLINPWGMSSIDTATTKGPIWVSDQGKGLATVYNPNASTITQGLTVAIPAVGTPSGPTGQVANTDTHGDGLHHPWTHRSGPLSLPLRHPRRYDRRLEPQLHRRVAQCRDSSNSLGRHVHRADAGDLHNQRAVIILPLRLGHHRHDRRPRHRRFRPDVHQRQQYDLRGQVRRSQRRRGLRSLQYRPAQR